MSLRRQFVFVFAAFAAVLSAAGGYVAFDVASGALEQELDTKLTQVAAAAAETGLRAEEIVEFQPGDEGSPAWEYTQERIGRLRRLVADEVYIVRPDLTALVTTFPPDELPVGARVRRLALYSREIGRALELGEATGPLFNSGGRRYKYGFVRLEQTEAILAILMPANYMEPLFRFRRTIILSSIASVILAAVIAWLLATTVTRPLERLVRAALRIQRGRMVQPIRTERGRELARLSTAMERMRGGILHRDEQLRLMLAQVAHEIRNPLGGLELLASAAVEADGVEERNKLLGKVRAEILNLNQIIDDFLTFARPMEPAWKLHDIRIPLEEAGELVGMEIREKGGTFAMDLPDGPVMARADPGHVKRIALNLLRNAAQAGSSVELAAGSERGEVVLSVRDNGPGVRPEMEDRIFEPFFTDKEKGAGLGLAIVKRIVEANLGRVEVVSGERSGREGAEFRVYFGGGEDLPALEPILEDEPMPA
jgi:signal transduction histidine kinase